MRLLDIHVHVRALLNMIIILKMNDYMHVHIMILRGTSTGCTTRCLPRVRPTRASMHGGELWSCSEEVSSLFLRWHCLEKR